MLSDRDGHLDPQQLWDFATGFEGEHRALIANDAIDHRHHGAALVRSRSDAGSGDDRLRDVIKVGVDSIRVGELFEPLGFRRSQGATCQVSEPARRLL